MLVWRVVSGSRKCDGRKAKATERSLRFAPTFAKAAAGRRDDRIGKIAGRKEWRTIRKPAFGTASARQAPIADPSLLGRAGVATCAPAFAKATAGRRDDNVGSHANRAIGAPGSRTKATEGSLGFAPAFAKAGAGRRDDRDGNRANSEIGVPRSSHLLAESDRMGRARGERNLARDRDYLPAARATRRHPWEGKLNAANIGWDRLALARCGDGCVILCAD
jgi:hypothetical protein